MDAQVTDRIRRTVLQVVGMLVRKDYVGIETLSNGVRLKAEHIEAGVNDYGRTLTDPPECAYDNIDVVAVNGRSPAEYSLRFRLFTKEEGQSDLELQATLIDDNAAAEIMRVEIDGILVA